MKPEAFKDLIYFMIIILGIAITFGGISLLEGSERFNKIKDWLGQYFNKHFIGIIYTIVLIIVILYAIVMYNVLS